MLERLANIEKRYNELNDELMTTEIISNVRETLKRTKEQATLKDAYQAYQEYKQLTKGIEEARDLLKDPGLDRTLLGDGIATFVAGAIGGPANTTYGENTSVVGMTKVASVWVIGLAAIIAIILGFFTKFTALISTIPTAVLGGVSLLLYGFISVNGLKVLIQNQVDFNNTKNVIVASAMLVLGLGGATISIVSGDLAVTISGMSLAAIVGIILNLCLPTEKSEEDKPKKEKKTTKKSAKKETVNA